MRISDWSSDVCSSDLFADPRLDIDRLDALQPTRPVMLASWTGHGAIVNSAAQRALALDLDAPVAGGWYGENDAGEFDGRLYEDAHWLLQAPQPLLPDATVIAAPPRYADRRLRHRKTPLQDLSPRPPRRFL